MELTHLEYLEEILNSKDACDHLTGYQKMVIDALTELLSYCPYERLCELAQADREGRCVVLRSKDTNVLTRADRIRTMSDEELTGQFGAQSNEPLTQTDLNKMYLNEVWLEYPDGSGETALVVWGKLYSTSVLEGAGLDLEEYIIGETLDAPTGTYKVYRRPPEGEEEKT